MNILKMRNEIAAEYPGVGWKEKCRTMPERQVIAMYGRLVNNGYLNPANKIDDRKDDGVQLTIFDLEV